MTCDMPLFPQKKLPSKKAPQQSAKQAQQLNAQLSQLQVKYKTSMVSEQFVVALEAIQQALKLIPNHPMALGDLALVYMRLQEFQKAYDTYLKAIKLSKTFNINLYDGLAEVCGYLGKTDEVKQYGRIALQGKIDQVKDQPAFNVPSAAPPALSSDKTRNIISFSLFGASPRYCETAMLNVLEAAILLPQWTCRFYCDETVPAAVRERLQAAGAQVIVVTEDIKAKISGLMWRFMVLDDPHVDRFLCRDADSIISTREQYAVNAWVNSGKWFHIMRDYATHTELILAGMWGGCNGVFKDLPQMMQTFIASGNFLENRVIDQHFLRHTIWPTIQQSLLHHDSVFAMPDSEDFPAHPVRAGFEQYPRFHVGTNIGAATIDKPTDKPEGSLLSWTILNETRHVVCRYQSPVTQGMIKILLPRPYAEKLTDAAWSLMVDDKIIEHVLS